MLLAQDPGLVSARDAGGATPLHWAAWNGALDACKALIAAGTSLGTMSVVLLGYRRLFTHDHQFLPGRLAKRQ